MAGMGVVLSSIPTAAQKALSEFQKPSLTETVHISADRVDYDRTREVLYLRGHVEIRQEPWRLFADEVKVDLNTRQAFATGGVKITQGEGESARTLLSADQAEVDLSGAAGWMEKARLSVPWQGGEITLHGQRMERVNETTYRIEEGSMTPCQCPEGKVPDWEVEAQHLTAETEKQVALKGARVKIRGWTVLYLPYLSYPIGTQRRTGFLLPILDLSSLDGFEVTLPFYWAFSPSADLTLYPHYIAQRGFESGAEARYNLDPAAQGEARAYFIPDLKEEAYRWSAQWNHNSVWGRGSDAKLDFNLISDNEYVIDFDHDLARRYDRYLESRLIADQAWPYAHLYGEFSWFDDLQGGDLRPSPLGKDRDELMVQRLPELRLQVLTRRLLGPLYADLSVRGDNYWRQEEDQGRGLMLDVFPRLVLPRSLGPGIQFVSAAGYHGILYRPDPDFDRDASALGQAEAAAQVSALLDRIYPGKPEGSRYRHTMEPRLFALYQSQPEEPNDPFFSSVDPRPERGYAGLNLEQRLFRKSNRSGAATAGEVARVEVTQSYDWVQEGFPDLRMEGWTKFGRGFRGQLDSYYGWDHGDWTRVEARLSYRDPRQNEYHLGYRWDTGEVKSQLFQFTTRPGRDLSGGMELGLGSRLRARYNGHYSLETGRFVSQLLGFDYSGKQKCWTARLTLSDRLRPDQPDQPHDYSASVTFQLEK